MNINMNLNVDYMLKITNEDDEKKHANSIKQITQN
jgi:hypothetical protein